MLDRIQMLSALLDVTRVDFKCKDTKIISYGKIFFANAEKREG